MTSRRGFDRSRCLRPPVLIVTVVLGLSACAAHVLRRDPAMRLAEPPSAAPVATPEGLFAARAVAGDPRLVGGPDAVGGVGDWLLGNGVLCAVVSAREHEGVLTASGGLLVDLGHCGRADDQWTVLQLHLLNLSAERIVPVEEIWAEVLEAEARVRTRGVLEGLEVETTYSLDIRAPRVLRIDSRYTRREDGDRLYMLGDAVLHGRRSLAPFVISTRIPSASVGFEHPAADPESLPSIIAAIHPADLHILVGSDAAGPGISYGLWAKSARLVRADGEHSRLAFMALNGRHFTLQAVFTRPLWFQGLEKLGWLQFGQTPFMDLDPGESIEVQRAIVVGDRADAAVVTDRFFPEQPTVSGRTSPDALVHVYERRDLPLLKTPFTVARADSEGRFSFHAPRGDYALGIRAPGWEVDRDVSVEDRDVDLGRVAPPRAPARVLLPRGRSMRLVFIGVHGTPDPRLRDDLLGFRVGGTRYANDVASRDVVLAGSAGDPPQVELPPGRYRVLASHGPEYETREIEIDLASDSMTSLDVPPLPRAFETPGWIAADLHVHAVSSFDSTLPMERQARAFAAQGGEVIVSTEHDFVADYAPILRKLGLEGRLASIVGTEMTGTAITPEAPYTIGHANAFPLPLRPDAYAHGALASEGRRLRDVVRQVRALGPHALLQLNHPRSGEFERGIADDASYFTHLAVAGRSFEPTLPLGEQPNAVLLEPDPETGFRDIDYDAVELMNGPSRRAYRENRGDWLSLLRQGIVRTATANSDSHGAATPVALPRTYVRVPDDRASHFEPGLFLRALRQGRAVGTSGPWIEVTLGDAGPGETWRGNHGVLRIAVRAAAWVPVSELRVRVDGVLLHRIATQRGSDHEIPLRFWSDAFVTVEVEGEAGGRYADLLPGFTPLAFSNPIFVDADADGSWRPPGLEPPLPPSLTDPVNAP